MLDYLIDMATAAAAGDRQAWLFWICLYAFLTCGFGAVRLMRIRRWPEVPGELYEAGQVPFGTAMVASEQTWRYEVRYGYVVDGTHYRGHRLSAWPMIASGVGRGVLDLQARGIRRTGDTVRVIHHPRKPQRSYLVRPGWGGIAVLLALALVPPALYFLHFGI